MYPKAAPSYARGSPKYNLSQANSVGKKIKKKPSPKTKKGSPKGILSFTSLMLVSVMLV